MEEERTVEASILRRRGEFALGLTKIMLIAGVAFSVPPFVIWIFSQQH
jgi:hypothetical protein